jgi:hypothetical protein
MTITGRSARGLEVVFHAGKRRRVAVEADVGDAGGGDQLQHPVQHAHARAQDGGEDQLLAGDGGRLHGDQRGLDLDQVERQVAGDLVADQAADLLEQLAEALGGGVLLPHQGQLVLHQRVADDRDALHGIFLRTLCRR